MASIISEIEAKPIATGPALGITAAVIIALIGFIALGAWIDVAPLYAGFLFVWLWSTLDTMDFKALAPSLVGALAGTGMSYLLQLGTHTANVQFIVLALLLMIIALFCVIAKRLPTLCNASTMLFITVLNAPPVQQHEDFRAITAAIVLSVLWFGGITWIIGWVVAGRAARI